MANATRITHVCWRTWTLTLVAQLGERKLVRPFCATRNATKRRMNRAVVVHVFR